jgi:aspartate racemase
MKLTKKIGIIGGMGAAASARFYDILVDECQKLGCVKDSDFPEVIIHSIPTAGISELGVADEEILSNDLERSVKMMEREGCKLILMACNTAHFYIDYLRSITQVYIIDMIGLSVVKCLGKKKVGLLSTRSTKELGLYTDAFEKSGIALLLTSEKQQKKIDKIIADITSGDFIVGNTGLEEIIEEKFKEGAEAVILGCTEIPLAYGGTNHLVFDTGKNAIKVMLRL